MLDRLLAVPVLGLGLALMIIVAIVAGFWLLALALLASRHGLLHGLGWWQHARRRARRA